jgi:hypothetical protein
MKKLTNEQKESRRIEREKIAKAARIESEKNQKPVFRMKINITWTKSRTWGNCPTLEAEIWFIDGSYEHTTKKYYASGWGYDKESTVIAELFNDYMKYKLYQVWPGSAPYGIYYGKDKTESQPGDERKSFNGGVGVECYYKVCEFIGGKFEHIASGKTFDVYQYTDNEERKY